MHIRNEEVCWLHRELGVCWTHAQVSANSSTEQLDLMKKKPQEVIALKILWINRNREYECAHKREGNFLIQQNSYKSRNIIDEGIPWWSAKCSFSIVPLEKPFTLTTTAAGVSRSTTPETILPNFAVSAGITLHGAKINAKGVKVKCKATKYEKWPFWKFRTSSKTKQRINRNFFLFKDEIHGCQVGALPKKGLEIKEITQNIQGRRHKFDIMW